MCVCVCIYGSNINDYSQPAGEESTGVSLSSLFGKTRTRDDGLSVGDASFSSAWPAGR